MWLVQDLAYPGGAKVILRVPQEGGRRVSQKSYGNEAEVQGRYYAG